MLITESNRPPGEGVVQRAEKEGFMTDEPRIRWGWLKGMYIYNIVATSAAGLIFIAFPGLLESLFKFPVQDSSSRAIYGSVLLAFGVVSILGLRAPLRVAPVLLMQVVYKLVWIATVALPIFLRGSFPTHILALVGIYATYIVGDLIAIPFAYVFGKGDPRTWTAPKLT